MNALAAPATDRAESSSAARSFRFLAPLLVAAVVCAWTPAHAAGDAAALRFHPLYSDHAVLQRDKPLPVRGWARPGAEVRVSLGARGASAVAAADGAFNATLEAQPMSTKPLVLVAESAGERVQAADILLGDVWLCGGQSNMEWSLGGCDAPQDIAAADLPLVRHFGVEYRFASVPQASVRGSWSVCTSGSAPGFTAVGFYFARKVHAETGVPIGLLRSCVGGTNIELWMSQATLLGTPELEPYARLMRESLDQYQRELAAALPAIERWSNAARGALDAGGRIPDAPEWPEYPFGERMFRPRCVTLHNGMIAPLAPFALRGILWYQGESNAGPAAECEQYIAKMKAMVGDWRSRFGDAQLPFYYVQLAAWQAPNDDPAHSDDWAMLRDAQRRAMALPGFGMASAIDVGDAVDIHPRNKCDVGERLALWALARDYAKPVAPSGPLYREVRREGTRLRVYFDHVGAGLVAARKEGRAPARSEPGAKLARFAVAGADRKWRWAEAAIDGDSVIVSHPEVPEPLAVRYAWAINPQGANLYNKDGLPASPFRSDDW